MFSNASYPDSLIEEGSITEVDPIRFVCKVKTLSGQNLVGVAWIQPVGGAARAADRVIPSLGDRVIIHSGLGYPVIWGFLPKLQSSENVFPLSIDTGETLVDTGNFSDSGKDVVGDQNAPNDLLSGDRLLTSAGGGMFGMLRGGSILIRSSRLSEIFVSKWDDLVRVVSRNWEQFTDVSSDIIKNINGRIYRYTGYAKLFKDAKVEAYNYHQYAGDVALAEQVKTDYLNAGALPAATDVIYKEQVTTGSGGSFSELYKRELHLDGISDLVVKNGSTFTRIKCTNGEITITYNDLNVIKVNGSEILLQKGSDQISVLLTDSSIVSTFNNAVHTLDSTGIRSTYNGAEHVLDSTGVSATFSGHFCRVTATGVSLG